MRIYYLIISLMAWLNCFSQSEYVASVDTLRIKGYVVIYTNEENVMGDIPFSYFFVRLNDMEEGFETALKRGRELVSSGDLFFISPLISDGLDISLFNHVIKNKLKVDNLKLQEPKINPRSFFYSNKTVYNVKETNQYFKFYYIDGVFIKINSPRKFRLLFSTPYQLKYMSDLVDYYNLYLLIDTKVIGYHIQFNDPDLILLE